MDYMTYDSPFSAIEEEVIPEVANFEEEWWSEGSEFLKNSWSIQGIEPRSLLVYRASK